MFCVINFLKNRVVNYRSYTQKGRCLNRMKSQLYLYDFRRRSLQKSIELFKNTYSKKINPVFKNIEDESKAVAEEKYQELGKDFHPDYHDPGDFVEDAWEAGIEHYEGMALMEYNTKLMWISTLYQFWEQQVRKFIYEEVTRTHKFICKEGKEILFKDFCTKGINDIKKEFVMFDQDLEKFKCWIKINELRLLTNVIKHGDGWSATELKKLRPDFFKVSSLNDNLLDLYKTTLNEKVLNINDDEFQKYCEAIIEFWDELPERMYCKD